MIEDDGWVTVYATGVRVTREETNAELGRRLQVESVAQRDRVRAGLPPRQDLRPWRRRVPVTPIQVITPDKTPTSGCSGFRLPQPASVPPAGGVGGPGFRGPFR